jgi:hypothetical protein
MPVGIEDTKSHHRRSKTYSLSPLQNQALVIVLRAIARAHLEPETEASAGAADDVEVDMASMHAAAEEIVEFLPKFTALLDVADEDAEQQQPYGTLKPRLGRRRLTVEFGKAAYVRRSP